MAGVERSHGGGGGRWRGVARQTEALPSRGRASNTSTNSRYCTHCGRTNHVVNKCWIKHGKQEWSNTVTSGGEPTTLEPSPNPESVTLSREEYEQLLHRPVANFATPTTSSSPGAFVAPHETPTRPLQVYSRRHRSTNTTLTSPPGLPPTTAPGHPSITPADDLPIALRKGKMSCTAHPLAHSLSFQHLIPNYRAFFVSLSSISIPNTYHEVLRHPAWKMAMDDEMSALISRGDMGSLWRYLLILILLLVDGSSPSNSVQMGPLKVNLNWTMYQMDIKNAFLYGDLNETVYLEQPPGYVAQGEKQRMVCKLKKAIYGLKQSPRAWFDKFSRIIGEFGFSRCQADHSVFVQTTTSGMVVLAVYVDDILITGSDLVGIEEAKTYLQKHFVTKDLGRPRYFFGIEIAHSKHGISLSQRKYACDLLQEAVLLGTKPVDTPMDSNPDFGMTTFMDKPRSVHWEAALRILKYIKASPGKGILFKRHGHVKIEAYSDADYAGPKDDRKSTSGYCTYVGGKLVTWHSKKQTTVARSSVEAEYRAMAHTTSEILWLKNLLKELGFMYDDPKGILTVLSARNNGFRPETITSFTPWLLTVGTSSIDRGIVTKVTLGNGKTIVDKAVNSFKMNGTQLPFVYGEGVTSRYITAPGVEILAAYSPVASVSGFPPIIGLLSIQFCLAHLSCPHAAAAAAYGKSAHPDWSPSAIKSALMTTAWPMDPRKHKDANFSYGTGHLNPVKATNPGLVHETNEQDYIELLCNNGYSA
ncbi:Retrovirus-related Pol polyprotein from transposon RE2 [Sesamum angolense]|uniref:Retrovirus-related Pol polyprotein from transposon RE2 n=1 Tax=Sesamum angolense TaxID=2727404 RepID=A0AAE1X0F5_9LAMI|nr:Retrovirus-related Pol polyprotein from transposon RE2 [Sesamum angolense]